MNLSDLYPVTQFDTDSQSFIFEFTSSGPVGEILKRVQYDPVYVQGYRCSYQLSFGDVDENDDVSFYGRAKNGDGDKIIGTVVSTLLEFFRTLPNCSVFFQGATEAHTRLYRGLAILHAHKLEQFLEIRSLVSKPRGNQIVLAEERVYAGNTYDIFVVHPGPALSNN